MIYVDPDDARDAADRTTARLLAEGGRMCYRCGAVNRPTVDAEELERLRRALLIAEGHIERLWAPADPLGQEALEAVRAARAAPRRA